MNYQKVRTCRILTIAPLLLPMATCAPNSSSGPSLTEGTTSTTKHSTHRSILGVTAIAAALALSVGGVGPAMAVSLAASTGGVNATNVASPLNAQTKQAVSPDPKPLLGKHYSSKIFQQYRQNHGCFLTTDRRWICEGSKTELYPNSKGIFTKVWMKPGYKSKLPKGLTFKDTGTDVLGKLKKYPGEIISPTFGRWDLGDGTILGVDLTPTEPHRVSQVSLSLK